ncbi:MAG: YkvA family protein [Candidatus Poribacteria bacterium]
MKKNGISQKFGQKKDDLKTEILAVWFAYRHPKTPWYAKIWLMLVAGYAFSPIDLIPDFIPVLGYLDDVLLLPLGIFIAIKLVPKDVMNQSRIEAKQWIEQSKKKPKSKFFILIVLIWLLIILVLIRYLYKIFF